MKFLYPVDPLNPKSADGPYESEFKFMKMAGFNCALFDYDMLPFGDFKPSPRLESGEEIIYRGWMMRETHYRDLETAVAKTGAKLVTDTKNYMLCHHLANWYEICKDLTAPTLLFPDDIDFSSTLSQSDWSGFFVKDYVKSNNDSRGSIAKTPSEISDIVALIKEYRGGIEGGVAIRKLMDFVPESEHRFFVFNGKIVGALDYVPTIVSECSKRINAPFFTIDIAETNSGEIQIVELGDGQVSELKEIPLERFVQLFKD